MKRVGKFGEDEMKEFEKKYKGKKFVFDPKDLKKELTDEGVDEDYFGTECTVTSLEVFVEDKLEDSYWNIRFDDGYELTGISGYHLKEVE